jgi:hypothetical protein
MAFNSGEYGGKWTRVMFGGTRRSFAACLPGGSCEETSSSGRFIAAPETCVSTSAVPVSRAEQTAPEM